MTRPCIVFNGRLVDLNEHEVYMLDEEAIVNVLCTPSEMMEDVAHEYHTQAIEAGLRRLTDGNSTA